MILDVLALIVVLLVAILGWRAGALHAAVRIAAFTGAFLLSRPLGLALATDVHGWMPGHPQLATHLSTLLAGAGLVTVFLLLGNIAARVVRGSRSIRGADKMVGLVLGTAKGAALAYALLCFTVALEKPLTEAFPRFGEQVRISATADWARDANLVDWLLERARPPSA